MPTLLELLHQCDALAESLAIVQSYLASARSSLRSFPDTHPRAALVQIADYLARQTEAIGDGQSP
jgi:geranylgeranyl pyrophosphate synthase